MEVPKEDSVAKSKIAVSAMFKNSEQYLCPDIKYTVTDMEGTEKREGIAAEVSIVEESGMIQLNGKNFDGKPIHLKIAATANVAGDMVYKRVTLVVVGAECIVPSISYNDASVAVLSAEILSEEAADAGSIADLFTNTATETCSTTIALETNEGAALSEAQTNVVSVAADGKVTIALSEFTESFGGRIKVNTGFDIPIYKPFRVAKKKTYRKTLGACVAKSTIKEFKEAKGVQTEAQCQDQCDGDAACNAFTFEEKTELCILIDDQAEVVGAGEGEGGACFAVAKDAYADVATLAVTFTDLLAAEAEPLRPLFQRAFYSNLYALKTTAAALSEAQRAAYDSCADGLKTPAVEDGTTLDYAKYSEEMHAIVIA